jgi:aryl-alcohol dehydrogenase-like predicted oxidoreductase
MANPELETRQLGKTGLRVSELALGTWRFGREDDQGDIPVKKSHAHALLDRFASRGGNFIDTANVYGNGRSETFIGEWLQERDRRDFIVASKVYWPTRDSDPNASGLNRRHIRRQIDETLSRLETTYLDVLYVHRWDETTDVGVVMRELNRLVSEGKVNYLGFSSSVPDAWKVARANEYADRNGLEPFMIAQPQYNLVTRQIETQYLSMCRTYDLGVVTWSPLAGGFLTGKYSRDGTHDPDARANRDDYFSDRYLTEGNFDILDTVRSVSDETGLSPAQVSLRWLLDQADIVSPIIGARTVEQLDENLRAAEVTLTDEQLEQLDETGDWGGY